MLLTITTTHSPATDLGYLLHKNPSKFQTFEESFGKVHVFYPEVADARCTAAMMLDVDPVDMVRGRAGSRGGGMLDQYVNDRPYVASSFLSVAIAQVFGTAMQGRCKERAELAKTPIPLEATLSAVPSRRRGVHSEALRAAGLRGHHAKPRAGREIPRLGRKPVLHGDAAADHHAV